MNENTKIRKLELKDCTPTLLDKFNRYQEINKCWRKENNEWILKDTCFIEQWDDKIKFRVIDEFINCINHGGIIYGAYFNDDLIGFACMENQLFGSRNEYIDLDSLQVSYEFRHKGIGKKLFEILCIGAKSLGAKKLYISANSSEETHAFYKAMGCVEATEINQELFEKEPFDCHMEYCL